MAELKVDEVIQTRNENGDFDISQRHPTDNKPVVTMMCLLAGISEQIHVTYHVYGEYTICSK